MLCTARVLTLGVLYDCHSSSYSDFEAKRKFILPITYESGSRSLLGWRQKECRRVRGCLPCGGQAEGARVTVPLFPALSRRAPVLPPAEGTRVDVLFSEKCDQAAAEACFRAMRTITDSVPKHVTTDREESSPEAIRAE